MFEGIKEWLTNTWENIKDIGKLIELTAESFPQATSSLTNLKNDFTYANIQSWLTTPVDTFIGTIDTYKSTLLYKCFNGVIVFAFLMLMLFFVVHIIDLMFEDKLEIEEVAKSFVTFLFTAFLMDNIYPLFISLNSAVSKTLLSSSLSTKLDPGVTISFLQTNTATLIGGNFVGVSNPITFFKAIFKTIGTLAFAPITTILTALTLFVIYVFIRYFCYARAIKLGISISMMPVYISSAFADSFARIKAIEHLKKIISLFLQVPVILITISVAIKLLNAAQTGTKVGTSVIMVPATLISTIAVAAILIKLIKDSEEICDKIIGV